MRKNFMFLLWLVPILEVVTLIFMSKWIGIWPTLLMLVLTSLLGVVLAKRQGLEAIRLAQVQLQHGQLPSQVLIDGLCILIGAILLIIPGFLTDIVGLLLMIPFTRNFFKAGIVYIFSKMIKNGTVITMTRRPF